ncbi:activator of osmoprotectant transporter prop [Pseudoduganella lutea]|uniref:Activator of osmoprotectant transporter prop n=2 Tax=Pseudoduganella lutea TaxID=321985 RepID=A0A4P6L5Y7_9BURK|nr:ProQ/FINO family protein [Pseudoduganella lutea]QBE67070.1 activator of osmoprotectant transporter prop [Pseudoduganella lutea]
MNTSLTPETSAAETASADVESTNVESTNVVDTNAAAAETDPAEGARADAVPAGAPAAPAITAPSARALLKQLGQQFAPFRDFLPLAIGIDKQILAQLPGIDRKMMRAALGIHTGSQRYLRAMEKATVRYNLDGSTGAEVTDVHRKHAKDTLAERFRKEAERKKAEREAQAADEAARRRQEKLEQLSAKFSRKG